jgi:hypothetical protein
MHLKAVGDFLFAISYYLDIVGGFRVLGVVAVFAFALA